VENMSKLGLGQDMTPIFLTLLLALGFASIGCRANARDELNQWCDAFQQAEKRLPNDPPRAYDFVNEHHRPHWAPLAKTAAGIRGIFAGGRYPMTLRFARLDYGLKDWECHAMDRILLGVAEREKSPSSEAARYPQLQVSRKGDVLLDGKPLPSKEVERTIGALNSRSNIVELYREEWRGAMHPVATNVLDLLVSRRFIVDLQPQPPANPALQSDDHLGRR
jgi:hypothetical protein